MTDLTTPTEERLIAAGEYVLGTLSPPERAAFAARIAGERAAAEAVRFWERALAPLAGSAAGIAPPPSVWTAIAARIGGVAPLANDRGRIGAGWRVAAYGLGAMAAALLSFLIVRPAPAPAPVGGQLPVPLPGLPVTPVRAGAGYIAALSPKGQEAALLLTFDAATGQVVAHPVKLSAPARRVLELWWIADGAKPSPVGLLDPAQPLRARVVAGNVEGGAFAVSVEPLGGSKTGAPTGPVIYSGAVVRAAS